VLNISFLNEIESYIAAKRYRLINSVLVYRYGETIYERYFNGFTSSSRHNLMSVWKSILSLVTGVCADNGLIDLDEPVSPRLPAFNERRDPLHRFITARHLLTMSSGIYWQGGVHYHCPMMTQMRNGSAPWLDFIADIPVSHAPGTRFHYKEWDVILLSAFIKNKTGRMPYDICREYIYEPLDIASDEWPRSACGVQYNALPGMEASALSARDLAKLGLMMLNGGVFNGRRIVSAGYVNECAAASAGWDGYGLLWWRSADGLHGRGFGGQELNVYPREDAVAVVQATVTPSSKNYRDLCEKIITKDYDIIL
jgi:CubicO group peptidase (beta-lactamase class C family)